MCTQNQFTVQVYIKSVFFSSVQTTKCTQGLDSDSHFENDNDVHVHVHVHGQNITNVRQCANSC